MPSFSVLDHGARGDGVALDTAAINAAIQAADDSGGGNVHFPPGAYLSYSIRLKSNITLQLDRGATILAAGDPPPRHEDILAMLTPDGILPGGGTGDAGSFYAGDQFGSDIINPPTENKPQNPNLPKPPSFASAFKSAEKQPSTTEGYDPPEPNEHDKFQDHGHSHWHNSLIWGEDLVNVAITGEGTIDGRGLTWNADPANPTGNKGIALKRCRNVRLTGFTMFRAGHFAVLATGCQGVTIDNITLDTNRDGLDIDSCKNVTITNCRVNSPNDDGIVLKSSFALGLHLPTENVTISNCHLSGYDLGTLIDGTRQTTQTIAPDRGGVTGRIKFGTESNGGFSNITISNCTFEHCRGIALESVDGGPLENITVSNITMRDLTSAPLFIRLGNRARGPSPCPVAIARNITFTNITATDAEPRFASLFSGIPGHAIEGLTLRNISLHYRGGGGLADAAIRPAEKEAAYPEPNMFGVIPAYGLFFRHVRNLTVQNISLSFATPDKRPVIFLDDVHAATFSAVKADHLPDSPVICSSNTVLVTLQDVQDTPDGPLADNF